MFARSWLFVPGNQLKHINKAQTLNADALIYDLEDAVADDQKDNARQLVISTLKNSHKKNIVRINALDTPYFLDDVQQLLASYSPTLSGLMLPKASSPRHVHILEYLLNQYEKQYSVSQPLSIIPIIECAQGLHHCHAIASASARIERLAFGAVDYALDTNIHYIDYLNALLYARSTLINTSRATGCAPPLDSVYVNFNDAEGLQKEVRYAQQLGFEGKLVIHPNQIDIVNQGFMPSEKAISFAQAVVAKAQESGLTAFQLNGQMVDVPVIKRAKSILETIKPI